MKKLLLLVIVAGLYMSCYSQSVKSEKSYEPFTAKSGHVFKAGDTLHFAKASMPDRTFKCAMIIPSKMTYLVAGSMGGPCTTFYENADFIIDHFIKYEMNGTTGINAYISLNQKYFHVEVSIDCALDEGEIVEEREKK